MDVEEFSPSELKKLYVPPADSHKGENGKLLIIAGSGLFHAPSIWPAEIASRIVDMVYVASTPSNNKILQELKGRFWDGIVVRREDLADYAKEADCILIGPGLPRPEGQQDGDSDSRELTKYVLTRLCQKSNVKSQMSKVVVDGGALQVMEPEWIPEGAILTPHRKEWERLLEKKRGHSVPFLKDVRQGVDNEKKNNQTASLGENSAENNLSRDSDSTEFSTPFERAHSYPRFLPEFAKYFNCIVVLKCGRVDYICSPKECRVVTGGNAGMTKGGTGDVLAGLVAALSCKNDPFLAACAGSYINKAAGDSLFEKVGYYYNSSDLLREIPKVMNKIHFSKRPAYAGDFE